MPRDYLQHARRHLPTGSDPIPGFGQHVLAAQFSSLPNIHSTGLYGTFWDSIFDNSAHFGSLSALPEGLGLDFVFDGSSPTITTVTDGAWAFTYTFRLDDDATFVGNIKLDSCGILITDVKPGVSISAHNEYGAAEVLWLPGNTSFDLLLEVTTASTASPYTLGGVEMYIVRLS